MLGFWLSKLSMNETKFLDLTDRILETLQEALEKTDLAIDYEFNEGVLRIFFDKNNEIVVNRHIPTRELWVAARQGAFHFAWQENDKWLDTRSGSEFFATLAMLFSTIIGKAFVFR